MSYLNRHCRLVLQHTLPSCLVTRRRGLQGRGLYGRGWQGAWFVAAAVDAVGYYYAVGYYCSKEF